MARRIEFVVLVGNLGLLPKKIHYFCTRCSFISFAGGRLLLTRFGILLIRYGCAGRGCVVANGALMAAEVGTLVYLGELLNRAFVVVDLLGQLLLFIVALSLTTCKQIV